MLAVAYRNIIKGSKIDILGPNGKDFARPNLHLRRGIQQSVANSLLLDLLERDGGYPSSDWRLAEKPMASRFSSRQTARVKLSVAEAIVDRSLPPRLLILARSGSTSNFAPARSLGEIAAYAFGPQEQQAARSGEVADFYRIWTLREASAKACGVGLPMLADGRDYFETAPVAGSWQSVVDGRLSLLCANELPGDCAIAVAIPLRKTQMLSIARQI
jgi:hypothetical protein